MTNTTTSPMAAGGDDTTAVGFTLNGSDVSARHDHPHLLAALREELDITSPKDGCSPTGQCGCCTVLIDGKARVSCQTSMEKVAGSDVVTLEGMPADEVNRMADAFAACGALQCGFCTPGHRRAHQGAHRQERHSAHARAGVTTPRRAPLSLHPATSKCSMPSRHLHRTTSPSSCSPAGSAHAA